MLSIDSPDQDCILISRWLCPISVWQFTIMISGTGYGGRQKKKHVDLVALCSAAALAGCSAPCSRTEKKKEGPLSHTPPCTILATNLLHLAYLLPGLTAGGQRYGGEWLWCEMGLWKDHHLAESWLRCCLRQCCHPPTSIQLLPWKLKTWRSKTSRNESSDVGKDREEREDKGYNDIAIQPCTNNVPSKRRGINQVLGSREKRSGL